MAVYVFNPPESAAEVQFIHSSLMNDGISRFGWSYTDTADLRVLLERTKEKGGWDKLNADEKECQRKAWFLLYVNVGDWVVHVNVPGYGKCVAGKVKRGYDFDKGANPFGDFRHTLELDRGTIIEFSRNDPNVRPYVRRRLGLPGRYHQIYEVQQFDVSIENLKTGRVKLEDGETSGMYHLQTDMEKHLSEITRSIHNNHPGSKLEDFFATILEKVPNVKGVKINWDGCNGDHGADLIVRYSSGLPICGLEEKESRLVVQVKSYADTHHDTQAIEQVKTGMEHYDADSGLIISTAAEVSKDFQKAFDGLKAELFDKGKNVGLLFGKDVAAFVLKYAAGYVM